MVQLHSLMPSTSTQYVRPKKKIEASKLINEHARSFTTGRGLDITMPVNKVVNVLPVTKPEVLFSINLFTTASQMQTMARLFDSCAGVLWRPIA